MVESAKSDKSPLSQRQAEIADNFPDRLKTAMHGRTAKWLSSQTGISTSTLSDYLNGKMPGADKAAAIAAALNANFMWLVTGRVADQLVAPADRQLRELLAPDARQQLADRMSGPAAAPPGGAPTSANDDDLVEVAEIDLRYGLGGTFIDDESIETEQRQFSGAWLRTITDSPPSMLFWSRGQGNSMSPTIEDGEIVLGDRSQTKPLTDDLIWACALGEIGMIKRLRIRADHVKLLSDNAFVPDDTVHPDDDLRIVGRIIAVIKNI